MQFGIWVAGIPQQLSPFCFFGFSLKNLICLPFLIIKEILSQVRNKMSKLKKSSAMN